MKVINKGENIELIPDNHKFTLVFIHGLADSN